MSKIKISKTRTEHGREYQNVLNVLNVGKVHIMYMRSRNLETWVWSKLK